MAAPASGVGAGIAWGFIHCLEFQRRGFQRRGVNGLDIGLGGIRRAVGGDIAVMPSRGLVVGRAGFHHRGRPAGTGEGIDPRAAGRPATIPTTIPSLGPFTPALAATAGAAAGTALGTLAGHKFIELAGFELLGQGAQ